MSDILYFGYGSNMDFAALTAKGVRPESSRRARLAGWRLKFNVAHFFRHEGGVGNIERTGQADDAVCGVLHVCDTADLAALDRLEGRGTGYDRIEVAVETELGTETAFAYVGRPAYIDDTRLPTPRYMNILTRGATAAGLEASYVDMLRNHPVLTPQARTPFAPVRDNPPFDHHDLTPDRTVLAGHIFCMREVRFAHELARDWFGGKEVTQFHLRRTDRSSGSERLQNYLSGDLRPDQRDFLNTYLHAFDEEYRHLGRFDYTGLPDDKIMI